MAPGSDSPYPPYLSIEMLTRLGRVMDQSFDVEQLTLALEETKKYPESDPSEQLAVVVSELGLRLTPTRISLVDAIWKARSNNPVVFWSERDEHFLIVTHASAFRVRLAVFKNGEPSYATLSRGRLAKSLGLRRLSDQVEANFIESTNPIGLASSASEADTEAQGNRYATRSQRKRSNHHHHDDAHGHHMPPFRRFLRILKPERKDIFLIILFAIVSGLLYLALPLAVDTVVTNLSFGGQSQPYLQALIVIAQILSAALLLQVLVIGFQYYIAEIMQRKIFVRAAGDIAHRLPRAKAESLDSSHGPELVNRFLDIVTVQKNTAFFILEGINVVASSLIGMVLLALFHPLLLVFVGVLIVLIVGITWALGRGAVKSAIHESQLKYDLVGWFEEIAAYPSMFKGSGGYEMAYQRTNTIATEFVRARTKHFGIIWRQIFGLLALSVVSSVVLLLLGTWLVLSQQITLGQLVASELIMSSIVASLIKLGKKLEAWYDTLAATDKLGHIFDLEMESNEGEVPSLTHREKSISIEANNLSFAYKDTKNLFSDLTFKIEPGQKVAIYGPQGSGVSSLLDLLFSRREPTDGSLSFDNLDSRSWKLESLRQCVQLLRRDQFIDGTIVDNLRLGRPDMGMDEIRAALEKVGLLEELLQHQDGLNRQLRVGGAPLSSTQRINLLIARVLVKPPRLLLIDELFDGLNDSSFQLLTDLILSKDFPSTVVVSTRLPSVIERCDWGIDLSNS